MIFRTSCIPVLPLKIALQVIKRKLETKLPYKFKGNDFRKFSWYIKKKNLISIYTRILMMKGTIVMSQKCKEIIRITSGMKYEMPSGNKANSRLTFCLNALLLKHYLDHFFVNVVLNHHCG